MANMAAGTSAVNQQLAILEMRRKLVQVKTSGNVIGDALVSYWPFFPLSPLTVPVVPEVVRAASVCGGKKDRGTGFSVLAVREMKREPKNKTEEGGG